MVADSTISEEMPLLPVGPSASAEAVKPSPATAIAPMVSTSMMSLQVLLLLFYTVGTTYDNTKDFQAREYVVFRDIMAMLLLGFGYLMTFLRSYGLGAVGFTLLLSVLAMLVNVPVEGLLRCLYDGLESKEPLSCLPVAVGMPALIDAEFAAATLMITFGALIGRASPSQMIVIMLSQSVFYAINKVWFVLGLVGAEDVGGSMTIHLFGAVFGLAASAAMGAPPDTDAAAEAVKPDKVSDVFSLVGTTILWVYWPSFVGATETAVYENEKRCIINTILALLASTASAFYMSHKLSHSKFDPVHIANATLAGGVAIGSGGRLDIGPGSAVALGLVAGAASVMGYVYSTPYLQATFSIHDTCGVGNLHGIPSFIGATASVVFVLIDSKASFLTSGPLVQMMRQVGGIIATMGIGALSGYYTATLSASLKDESTPSYEDYVWWHSEYFVAEEEKGEKEC